MNRTNEIQRSIFRPVFSQRGFTIVEILLVLVLLGLLAAIAFPRYINLEASSTETLINSVVSELNNREMLTWSYSKISTAGYIDDTTLQAMIDYDLGDEYRWVDLPSQTGGTLAFNGRNYPLTRAQSSNLKSGFWSR